jgi:hypothetical protein
LLAARPQRSEDGRQASNRPFGLAAFVVLLGEVQYNLATKNNNMGTKMNNLREEVFDQVFRAGAIRSVRLVVRDGRASVVYVTGEGVDGVVYTKRGDVKFYRIETALVFLRRIGAGVVEVDMRSWALDGQVPLL